MVTDTLILYWEPGSGGDTVQRLLSNDPNYQTVIEKFELNSLGRTEPTFIPYFSENFVHDTHNWLKRSWTHDDIKTIQSWPGRASNKTMVIPTHDPRQALWLKEHIADSKCLGIYYPKNLYPFVLSNWCKKIAGHNQSMIDIYHNTLHKKLARHDMLGAYILKEQIFFGSNIPKETEPKWDINLSLERLLIGDLSTISALGINLESAQILLQKWLDQQNPLYKWRWSMDPRLKEALGSNELAPTREDLDQKLDVYDQILIREWCRINRVKTPGIGSLTNLGTAHLFFKNLH